LKYGKRGLYGDGKKCNLRGEEFRGMEFFCLVGLLRLRKAGEEGDPGKYRVRPSTWRELPLGVDSAGAGGVLGTTGSTGGTVKSTPNGPREIVGAAKSDPVTCMATVSNGLPHRLYAVPDRFSPFHLLQRWENNILRPKIINCQLFSPLAFSAASPFHLPV
jgi:hypothetical protein